MILLVPHCTIGILLFVEIVWALGAHHNFWLMGSPQLNALQSVVPMSDPQMTGLGSLKMFVYPHIPLLTP